MRKEITEANRPRVLARVLALQHVRGGNSVCATGKAGGGLDITDTQHGDGCRVPR
jgi:hypothetical protein